MTLVFDSNIIISAALIPSSISYKAFEKGLLYHKVVRSEQTFAELVATIFRKKFDSYFESVTKREEFLSLYLGLTEITAITRNVEFCRDPKDDKYLSLALSASADLIISGDKDLLVLNPFEKIEIISPFDFVNRF